MSSSRHIILIKIFHPTEISDPTPLMHIRLKPYNVASSKTPDITSGFLDQVKDLKSQMLQMQQTQNFLLNNIMSKAWPPLPAQKVNPFQAQMF